MPNKLLYNNVFNFFKENGCILISKEYFNSKDKLKYISICGHERIATLDNVKFCNTFKCKSCTVKKIEQKYYIFKKIKKSIESQFENNLKYRTDFLEENINKLHNCVYCKNNKPLYLFYNDKNNTNKKRSICKQCTNIQNNTRQNNHNLEQFINKLLKCAESCSRKRLNNGRINSGEFLINIIDIMNLIDKQNNKCVYTGQELIWKQNNYYKLSIDRIDSDKGYILDNIQLVAMISNHAKSDLSEKGFLEMVKQIYEYRQTLYTYDKEFSKSQLIFIKYILKVSCSSSNKRQIKGRIMKYSITLNDILELIKKQNNKCFYTGQEFIYETNNNYKISIDRIDSDKGYILENIQLVSWVVNQAKNDLSEKDFLEMIKYIYEYRLL